jgi:hypothetical protein
VFASDDAAATVTAARTVADGGIEGLPPRRVSPHDASTRWEKGIAIKTEPRIWYSGVIRGITTGCDVGYRLMV